MYLWQLSLTSMSPVIAIGFCRWQWLLAFASFPWLLCLSQTTLALAIAIGCNVRTCPLAIVIWAIAICELLLRLRPWPLDDKAFAMAFGFCACGNVLWRWPLASVPKAEYHGPWLIGPSTKCSGDHSLQRTSNAVPWSVSCRSLTGCNDEW